MRAIKTLAALLVLMAVCGGACRGEEMRGAWVTAWTAGFFTPEQVDATIEAARSCGLNALFIQVRKNADAYYVSNLEPRGADLAQGYDPLADIIQKARKHGIEVHAWMNTFRVWTAKDPPADPEHIVNRRPGWINKNSSGAARSSEGLYLDPGAPEAREHIAAVAEDIARRYKVDGIHLDYVRYPGREWGYSEIALRRYRAETGASATPEPNDPRWLAWRRDQVTELVRMVSSRVRAARPGIKITAATIPWGDCPADYTASSPYATVCQDWQAWLTEGLLDANVPMNYKVESNPRAAQQFRNWLAGFKKWGGGKPVYVGIDVNNNDIAGVRGQMEAIAKAGLDGFVWFSFNASRKRAALVEAFGSASPAAGQARRGANPASQAEFDKGIRYAVANQLGMAKVHLRKAIELDPNYAEAHFRLGRCYLRERNIDRAMEYFRKTLELDPEHDGAKNEIASLGVE